MSNARYRPATEALHAGEEIDPKTGATSVGISPAISYRPKEGAKVFSAQSYSPDMGFNYARWGSPTVRALEERVAALEGTEDAVAFASGMAANTAVMLDRLQTGDRAIFGNVCYPGVAEFAHNTLAKLGIEVAFVNPANLSEMEAALRKRAKLVFVETPANPILRLCDLKAIAGMAHAAGAEVAVDSTFATPAATNPAALGVDFTIHSLTKFLNGHGDVLGGAVAG
ncbi:MAG TPA: aminotransferase class V-fold PLP-dependent enzyme, partial [Sphingomonadales bacterium]|nr:aminotransferase class V-fold PLP-dependent enzyme [Sphingomonadales bacterium]